MSSIIRADTIQDLSGNNIINESGDTITIGASGDTTNIVGTLQNNGSAVGGANTPSFYAFLNANQSAGTGADTTITLNAEAFDTDNAFDTSTYKFTPQTAGKYFLYAQARIDSGTDFNMLTVVIRKNGSEFARGFNYNDYTNTVNVSTIIDMNGSSDYIDMFAMQNSGGSLNFAGASTQANSKTYLMGYKLIGV
jgi:hypothetical protein